MRLSFPCRGSPPKTAAELWSFGGSAATAASLASRMATQVRLVRLFCPLAQEPVMSSTSDKIKGTADQAVGKLKQGVGEATDNPKLKSEGHMQEAKGKFQIAVGDAKAAIKKVADL